MNFLVVLTFLRFRNELLTVNNNKFLFSMAVSDCLVGLFGIIGGVLSYLAAHGKFEMKIEILFGRLPLFGSFYMSILSLGFLTMDRFIAVVYALRYHWIMTTFRVRLLVFSTWVTVIATLLVQGGIFIGISWVIEVEVRAYQLATFFVLATFVLCVGNIKLHSIIRSKQQRVSAAETWCSSATHEPVPAVSLNMHPKRSIVRMSSESKICIWMTTIFIICWCPITIDYICYVNGILPYTMYHISSIWLASLNSLLNPIIYLIKRKNFRTRFGILCISCAIMGNRETNVTMERVSQSTTHSRVSITH